MAAKHNYPYLLSRRNLSSKISDATYGSSKDPLIHSFQLQGKEFRRTGKNEYFRVGAREDVLPDLEICESTSKVCVTEYDYEIDAAPDSNLPSTCTCWDEMTSSHSIDTKDYSEDESLESGIGEVDYESDLFEAGLDELGEARDFCEDVTDGISAKLIITPSSSVETKLLSRGSSMQSCDSIIHPNSTLLPSPQAKMNNTIPFFKNSLFHGFPPTINFPLAHEQVDIPSNVITLLKWRPSTITPQVVKTCIAKAGFRMSNSKDWIGYFGKHMKSATFKSVKPFQKVNHLPGSFHMGRKDTMWRGIFRMQSRYSKREFDFVPQTFVLPGEFEAFRNEYESKGIKARWIMKPPASARGIGIQMVKKISQIPRNRPVLVQQYISNPMLINGSKCDLRIYVYITSMDPLRLYIYEDGLVRFATVKYSTATRHLSNRFVHLTNYSVNKKNKNFQANSDETVRQGHKWGLKALWPYLAEKGVDSDKVWRDIKELVLKTVLASENYINSQIKANARHKECAFELFGFDVMLDEKYKPWLIEVNISPSLHSSSGLDLNIKGPMLCHVLNLTGYRLPDQLWHRIPLTHDEKSKHAHFVNTFANDDTFYNTSILDTLTPDDMRMLIETEDELTRMGKFQLVFPTPHTVQFLKYFSVQRYYNLLLHAWFTNPSFRAGRGVCMLQEFARQGIPFKTQPPSTYVWMHKTKSLIKPLQRSPKKYKLPALTSTKTRKKKTPKILNTK